MRRPSAVAASGRCAVVVAAAATAGRAARPVAALLRARSSAVVVWRNGVASGTCASARCCSAPGVTFGQPEWSMSGYTCRDVVPHKDLVPLPLHRNRRSGSDRNARKLNLDYKTNFLIWLL